MASNQGTPASQHKNPGDDGFFGSGGGIPFHALGIAPLGFLAPPAGTGPARILRPARQFPGQPDRPLPPRLAGSRVDRSHGGGGFAFRPGDRDDRCVWPSNQGGSVSAGNRRRQRDLPGDRTGRALLDPRRCQDRPVQRLRSLGICGGSQQSRFLPVRLSCWIGARTPGPDRVREDHDRWIAAAFVAANGHLCRCRIEGMEGLRLDREYLHRSHAGSAGCPGQTVRHRV